MTSDEGRILGDVPNRSDMNKTLMNILDADQRRAVENIRDAANRIWARPLHRYFTDHTVAHTERIIALMDGLTAGMMAVADKRLMPTEVFVLLCAAYLHDIGMQNEKFAKGDLDKIRAHHNEQTAEMIYRVFEDPANAFAIPLARDPGLVESVALVAKGHRGVKLDGAEYASIVHGDETLRLHLLAALLRFGDELDIDHRRVDLETIKLMTIPPESQLHWWKCHYVSGVSIVDEYIKIAYRLPQDRPDYEGLIVPLVENEIRAKLASLEEIFRANGIKVAIAKSEVRRMRLVQPMPVKVERLAKKGGHAPADKASGSKKQEARGAIKKPTARGAGKKPRPQDGPQEARPTTTVFDMRGQKVNKQINVAGNYIAPTEERQAVGTPKWNTEVIRALLNAAFSDEEIRTLCFDHFRAVYDEFATGMSKGDKLQRLLDQCERYQEIEQLLAHVQARNPAQYARFESQLRN
jgi:hypothetical protein